MSGVMRPRVRRLSLATVLVLAAQVPSGQELPRLELRVKEIVPVQEQPGLLVIRVPAKCDREGNIYLRRLQSVAPLSESPIIEITPEGKIAGTFSMDNARGFEEASETEDWEVDIHGRVYVLGTKDGKRWYIAKFQADGGDASLMELAPVLLPHRFSVFPSGELLVAGVEISEETKEPTGKPLLTLYDRFGNFVQEISLPRDLEPTGATEDEATAADRPDGSKLIPDLTHLVSAEDGNIYLLRRLPKALVYVISPAGAVTRRLVVPPPLEGFEAVTIKVGGGKIVVEFRETQRSGPTQQYVFSIVDAQTGERFADYWSTREARGIWACYTPDGFTFVGATRTKPATMTLIRAAP